MIAHTGYGRGDLGADTGRIPLEVDEVAGPELPLEVHLSRGGAEVLPTDQNRRTRRDDPELLRDLGQEEVRERLEGIEMVDPAALDRERRRSRPLASASGVRGHRVGRGLRVLVRARAGVGVVTEIHVVEGLRLIVAEVHDHRSAAAVPLERHRHVLVHLRRIRRRRDPRDCPCGPRAFGGQDHEGKTDKKDRASACHVRLPFAGGPGRLDRMIADRYAAGGTGPRATPEAVDACVMRHRRVVSSAANYARSERESEAAHRVKTRMRPSELGSDGVTRQGEPGASLLVSTMGVNAIRMEPRRRGKEKNCVADPGRFAHGLRIGRSGARISFSSEDLAVPGGLPALRPSPAPRLASVGRPGCHRTRFGGRGGRLSEVQETVGAAAARQAVPAYQDSPNGRMSTSKVQAEGSWRARWKMVSAMASGFRKISSFCPGIIARMRGVSMAPSITTWAT